MIPALVMVALQSAGSLSRPQTACLPEVLRDIYPDPAYRILTSGDLANAPVVYEIRSRVSPEIDLARLCRTLDLTVQTDPKRRTIQVARRVPTENLRVERIEKILDMMAAIETEVGPLKDAALTQRLEEVRQASNTALRERRYADFWPMCIQISVLQLMTTRDGKALLNALLHHPKLGRRQVAEILSRPCTPGNSLPLPSSPGTVLHLQLFGGVAIGIVTPEASLDNEGSGISLPFFPQSTEVASLPAVAQSDLEQFAASSPPIPLTSTGTITANSLAQLPASSRLNVASWLDPTPLNVHDSKLVGQPISEYLKKNSHLQVRTHEGWLTIRGIRPLDDLSHALPGWRTFLALRAQTTDPTRLTPKQLNELEELGVEYRELSRECWALTNGIRLYRAGLEMRKAIGKSDFRGPIRDLPPAARNEALAFLRSPFVWHRQTIGFLPMAARPPQDVEVQFRMQPDSRIADLYVMFSGGQGLAYSPFPLPPGQSYPHWEMFNWPCDCK